MNDEVPENFEAVNENDWVELRKIGKYVYMHEKKCDAQKVAFLIYRDDGMLFARHENTPCHGEGIQMCSFTGSVEDNDPVGTTVMEVLEEAGMTCDREELEYLGTSRPYKATDAIYHLYALDGTGRAFETPKGDGSDGEKGAYCEWIPSDNYANCKDPLVAQMLVRLNMSWDRKNLPSLAL